MINGKPKKIMHDNGKQFTSKILKRFPQHNNMKDKPIPNSYPSCKEKYRLLRQCTSGTIEFRLK